MYWSTKITYVDKDTGEEITKKHIDKQIYFKTKSHAKKTIKGNYGIITILWECERNKQTKLDL